MRKNPAVICAVRKLFDDDARKLTLTLQELQSMMSAVVAEAISLTTLFSLSRSAAIFSAP